MKLISTNIAVPHTFLWEGKEVSTGIVKKPVDKPLYLSETGIKEDLVADLKVHGGKDKACYLFSADHYPYWQERYPHLDWDWGMFGENLTCSSFDENLICIGDIFRIGNAVVQVSQPREPCFKLGYRLGKQEAVAEFISHGYPGAYLRVLREGTVRKGDKMVLRDPSPVRLSLRDFFQLVYSKEKDPAKLELALNNSALPARKKKKLSRLQ